MGLNTVFLVIALLALAMNILLIATVVNISRFSPVMALILALTLVDMIIPIVTIIAVSYNIYTGNPIDAIPNACNLKGPIDFIGIFLSMLLVSLIALFRASRIVGHTPLYSTVPILGLFSLVFISLVIACAVQGEFRVLADGVDCAPISSTSSLSRVVLILHSFALLLFLCITVCCYIQILISSSNNSKDFPEVVTSRWAVKRPVVIRITATITSYLLITLPPAVLLFLEATLIRTKVFNTPIDLFLTSIPLLNPTLILLSHSLLFQQLLLSSQRLQPRFVQ
ncbi:hypothetical protein DSO57_1031828 [Entomophthora muscae]|uniref:Uncharacterized protein n=1 Tax=Entomophthora muscae TaxID=34485 RepID=A0ACC2RFA6_9FUNG|nr:hypothetical protein DSO57_1031828 [Entomophthora muscae]